MRNVYIIAGANGAGKTTFAREFLPTFARCDNFVNADLIAEGVAPFSPQKAAARAGRLVLEEIRRYSNAGVDFGFETTLSGIGYQKLFSNLQAQGYAVWVFYLWLSNADLAVLRVAGRVQEGGHGIPEDVVRRRYSRSVRNFVTTYRSKADCWLLFDNSSERPVLVARKDPQRTRIMSVETFEAVLRSSSA